MSKWVNDYRRSSASDNRKKRHRYLADDQGALLGWGHGWLTFHIIVNNHSFHRFCFPIAQIQR